MCCRAIDFGELLSADVRCRHKHTTYDLIANVVHDGEPGPGKGTYRVHILHKVSHSDALPYWSRVRIPDKMPRGQNATDKMPPDKMPRGQNATDKMPTDKMPTDKVAQDKVPRV